MSLRFWRVFASATFVCLAGCVGEKGVAPTLAAPDQTIGVVRVAPANAIMAVGATLQLDVAAQSLGGQSITTLDSVQYLLQRATDTLRVRISSSGAVTALATSGTGQPVLVNVVAFKHGVAKADQAVIQITAIAIQGATLSIQPVLPDSAILAQGSYKTIVPLIENATTGETVDNPTIRYRVSSADDNKLGFYRPVISTPTLPNAVLYQFACRVCTSLDETAAVANSGTAWLYADVNVYGVMLHDSVRYTLTNPISANVIVADIRLSLWGPPAVYIAPGAIVNFVNGINSTYGATASFTFDNPTAATATSDGGPSGNTSELGTYESTDRQFLTPGTYTWTATVAGSSPPFTGATATGQIIVQ